MSRLFFNATEQPFLSEWEKAAVIYTDDKDEVKNLTECIKVVKSLSLPKLAEDIWDLIIWYILRYTPKLNSALPKPCLLQWMFNWMSDPLQQKYNNLSIYEDRNKMMLNLYSPVYKNDPFEQSCIISDPHIASGPHTYRGPPETIRYSISGGDLFLGISIEEKDIPNIKSCTLQIGCTILADYVFTNTYKINIPHPGRTFYYNPQLKVVPSCLIGLHPIVIELSLHPNTNISPLLSLHSYIFNQYERKELVSHPYVFKYHMDSSRGFLVANGMGCDFQSNDIDKFLHHYIMIS